QKEKDPFSRVLVSKAMCRRSELHLQSHVPRSSETVVHAVANTAVIGPWNESILVIPGIVQQVGFRLRDIFFVENVIDIQPCGKVEVAKLEVIGKSHVYQAVRR